MLINAIYEIRIAHIYQVISAILYNPDSEIMKCRICSNTDLKKILSLGTTPLANSFLTEEQLKTEEKRFPLEICFCDKCKLVQLTHVVPPEDMFRNYVYVTSTTNTFKTHFTGMAQEISKRFGLNNDSLVVDIGSNDGLLLSGFQAMGVQAIGIEPATNVARIAEQNGVETINDFFSEASAKEVIKRKTQADAVTATNVFAHVNDITDFTKNVKMLLKKSGIFVIEIQYLADTMQKMTFDNIYHEHLSYFTLTSLNNFFKMNGMEIFDVKKVESHGGSLRVFVKRPEGTHKIEESVKKMLDSENRMGIGSITLYKDFAEKVQDTKRKLVETVKKLKSEGKVIAAYGAPAKGNTLLNFCGIGSDYISYVVDDNPLKTGLFTPGTHIPVVSSGMLDEKKPDYVIILAWNFAEEILAKTRKYAEQGVKFIIPLPSPTTV